MKIIDVLSLSTRMFRTRPTRTWLTILGISVGISAVVFLVSLGYGLQKIILEKIVFSQALLSLTVTPINDTIQITNDRLLSLQHIDHVTNVAPLVSFNGQVTIGQVNGNVEVRAANASYFDYAGVSTVSGALYAEDKPTDALVSEAVLRLMGITDEAKVISQPFKLRIIPNTLSGSTSTQDVINIPAEYRVVGVVRDSQNSFIYVPLKELSKSVVMDHYDQVQVKVDDSKNLLSVKDQVIAIGYQVQSLQDTVDQANKIFQIFQIVLGLFGAVALVVSGIGMFNTMTVTLLERTNEIGIMRALGASKLAISTMFICESMILGLLGGVTGIILGIIGANILNTIVNSVAVRFGGTSAGLFYYPLWFLTAVIIISTAIGFLSGVYTARRAAIMDPLEALRYK